jgi:sugar lactone lactonase YvrE
MPDHELTVLIDGGDFFEGPRWHDGRWFVSDFYQHAVLAIGTDGKVETVMEVAGQPSGLGWMPDGSLLAVSMLDRRILRRYPSGEVVEHADLSGLAPGHLNDMVVDSLGRAYVGNLGFEMHDFDPQKPVPTTVLVRVDPDGSTTAVAAELNVPNGTVITPDGHTLIVGEATGARYTAFTINDDGSLGERRVWGQLPPDPPAGPDGCTLDAEGHIWMADPSGAPCRRLAPGAVTVDLIEPPEGMAIYACMLGGPDGRTLLLCAADNRAWSGQPLGSAVLFTTTVDVPHAGLP